MDNYCLVGSMENMAHLSLNDLDMEVVFPHLWRAIQKKRLAHFTIQKTFFSYLSCFNIFKSQVLAGQISTVCLQIPISFRFQAFVQIPISLGKAQQGAQPALRDPSVMPICGIGAIGTICGIGIGCICIGCICIGCICICGAGAAAFGVMDRPGSFCICLRVNLDGYDVFLMDMLKVYNVYIYMCVCLKFF